MAKKQTLLLLTVSDCRECPKNTRVRTPNSGFAIDLICSLTGQVTSGYVEWEREINPVPSWCPLAIASD